MNREILDILKEYEDNNCLADYFFIKRILTIVRKHYHTDDYLDRVFTAKRKENVYGIYYPLKRMILIDIEKAIIDDKTIKDKNISVVIALLHEFEHVLQNKYYYKDHLYHDLLTMSYVFDDENNKIHDYMPNERLANILSTYKAIKILSQDYFRYKKNIYDLKVLLYYYIKLGYRSNNTEEYPLLSFVNKTNID